jgi:hypothetical protein
MALPIINSIKYHLVVPSTSETIEFRPYTVREEKAILLASETGDSKAQMTAAKDLVVACTMGNVDVDKLSMFDFEYIFLKLRGKSVGETSNIGAKCSSCSHSNEIIVDLDEVQVQGEIKPPQKFMISDDIGIMISYPEVSEVMKQLISTASKNEYEQSLALLISCIDSIFDSEQVYEKSEHSPKEMIDFVERIPSTKFKALMEMMKEMPTLRHETDFKCQSCGAENKIILEGLQSFF